MEGEYFDTRHGFLPAFAPPPPHLPLIEFYTVVSCHSSDHWHERYINTPDIKSSRAASSSAAPLKLRYAVSVDVHCSPVCQGVHVTSKSTPAHKWGNPTRHGDQSHCSDQKLWSNIEFSQLAHKTKAIEFDETLFAKHCRHLNKWTTQFGVMLTLFQMVLASRSRTVLAVAGEDFAVVASDTRLSERFSIHSRNVPKTKIL